MLQYSNLHDTREGLTYRAIAFVNYPTTDDPFPCWYIVGCKTLPDLSHGFWKPFERKGHYKCHTHWFVPQDNLCACELKASRRQCPFLSCVLRCCISKQDLSVYWVFRYVHTMLYTVLLIEFTTKWSQVLLCDMMYCIHQWTVFQIQIEPSPGLRSMLNG